MADTKLTALSALTVITEDDLLYVVDDPAGTPASKKATAAVLRSAMLPRNFIMGGVLDDATNTTISCSAITAFIESLGYCITASPSNLTITVGASALGYVYLKSDGTLSDSTTAPVAFATPAGNARSKSGDTSQRFIGWYFTDGSSHIITFTMFDLGGGLSQTDYPSYVASAPYRVLSAGTAASYGSETSFAGILPPNICTNFYGFLQGACTGISSINFSLDGTNPTVATIYLNVSATLFGTVGWYSLRPATPGIYYKGNGTAPTTYIDIMGARWSR